MQEMNITGSWAIMTKMRGSLASLQRMQTYFGNENEFSGGGGIIEADIV